MLKREVLTFLIVVLIPIVLVETRVACPSAAGASRNAVEVIDVRGELNSIHCKGAEFNVSVTVVNRAKESVAGFIEVDGWDLELAEHATGGLIRVSLKPGERASYWIMLPVDTQEPKEYYFNATFVPQEDGSSRVLCGEEGSVPLYKYLLLLAVEKW